MNELTPIKISFDRQPAATAVLVQPEEDPARALAALALPPYHGTVVVHGGAGNMEEDLVRAVRRFVVDGLAPLAEERRLLVIDGGTHIGTSLLMGDARRAIGGTYPLVGVVPYRRVSYPGGPPPDRDRTPLNTAHSHFIFVMGETFGVESDLMVGLLRAAGQPGLALVINGGEIVFKEAIAHAQQGNMLIALQGSGRTADRLADPASEERRTLPAHARLWVVDIQNPAACVTLLKTLLDTTAFYAPDRG